VPRAHGVRGVNTQGGAEQDEKKVGRGIKRRGNRVVKGWGREGREKGTIRETVIPVPEKEYSILFKYR